MNLSRPFLRGITIASVVVAAAGWIAFFTTSQRSEPPALVAGKGSGTKSPGVKTAPVGMRALAGEIQVVGSVTYDQDHYAIVGPLIAGRVVQLSASLGDGVHAGEVLGEIESPAVGQAHANYIASSARAQAAAANLRREVELTQQRVSSEREREVAEALSAQEGAALRAAEQNLKALGLRPGDIATDGAQGRVALRSPITGTVVERHVSLGEAVEPGSDAFVVANLSRLWVLLDIYEKDLGRVQVGQKVELHTESLPGRVLTGSVAYVDMRVDVKTRTAHVRVEFVNDSGVLRAGQFVTARLLSGEATPQKEVLAVPNRAIEVIDEKPVVFVKAAGDKFEPRAVVVGSHDPEYTEIVSGLVAGAEVVVEGGFLLKSKLLR